MGLPRIFQRKKHTNIFNEGGVPFLGTKTIENYKSFIGDALGAVWNGDKYPGSFGTTKIFDVVDYWTLRKRSVQLFKENLYAKGIVRRILRNEIHTGIIANSTVLGPIVFPNLPVDEAENKAVEFSEMISERFSLYGETKEVFDFKKQMTFSEFQEQVRFETIISGDGVIVERINPKNNLPCWEYIDGDYIKSPASCSLPSGHQMMHGVEIDEKGEHIAYYVEKWSGEKFVEERIPCYGPKSKRRVAWMVYGGEKRISEVRGEPILGCILSIIKDLDRYRDAESRAAVVNAMLPLFVYRTPSSTIGTRPSDGLARLQSVSGVVNGDVTGEKKTPLDMRLMLPGQILENLAPGEEIKSFQTNRPNVNYSAFEQAILSGICWALEVPPEIVMLKFQSNYSASRQANNEFEIYLEYQVKKNAKRFCQPIYEEFLIQSALTGQIELPGFLESILFEGRWQVKAAWLNCSWTGLSRPSVDPLNEVKASQAAIDAGFTTYETECRKHSGQSFRQVMQKRRREEDYMKSIGFVPHANEDNNGKPAYPTGENGDEAAEENQGLEG